MRKKSLMKTHIFELRLNNKLKIELIKKCDGFVEKEIVDPVTGKLTIISNGCHGCGGALKEIILEPVGGGGDFDIRQEGFKVRESLSSRWNSDYSEFGQFLMRFNEAQKGIIL